MKPSDSKKSRGNRARESRRIPKTEALSIHRERAREKEDQGTFL